MRLFRRRKEPNLSDSIRQEIDKVLSQLEGNSASLDDQGIRRRLASAISGGYDFADTLHNIYCDYGYPHSLDFFNFWNMYRRFGIARNAVELPVDIGWVTEPTVEGSEKFQNDLDVIINTLDFWKRMKGLDTRQRVGRYAGMFMRVRDGKKPSEPIDGTLSGVNTLVDMMPLYEGQLRSEERRVGKECRSRWSPYH